MKNSEIAQIFYDIADILEMQDIQFKPVAYRRAARNIESLPEELKVIYGKGGVNALMEIPGVGENISKKIEELLKTGKLGAFEKLKRHVPKHISELMQVQSLGPKKIKVLHDKLGISTLKQLEEAAKNGKIRKLPNFGEKSEQDILKGIQMLKQGQERRLLGDAYPLARELEETLSKQEFVNKVAVAGSLRRMKETIGDFDILCTSKSPDEVMDFFTRMPAVKRILAKGHSKSMVVLDSGMQADLRVVSDESYGAALQYFTGNKEHNIALRKIAIKKGLKLSEYGVFNRKTGKKVAGRTEEEFYNKLGMPYIEPELRENKGEIEAAIKHKLPKIIGYDSIKGDLHMHTKYSDGNNTVEEMAIAAKKLGYEYICISDHSVSEKVAGGMDEKMLEKCIAEVRAVNKKLGGIRIFVGAEVDIRKDGSLDYSNDVLKKLDIIIASVHSGFKMPESEMTKRIVKALENPCVDFLAHPTGRMINQRAAYNVNLEKIFDVAKQNNVMLEINAFPDRLDLNDVNTKAAIDAGVKLVINTDAHNKDQLRYMFYGIATARRGWAEGKDIINTLPLKQLLRFFKNIKLTDK